MSRRRRTGRRSLPLRLLRAVLAVPGGFVAAVLLWSGLTHLRFVAYHRRQGLPYPRLGPAASAASYARSCAAALRVAWWVATHGLGDGTRPRGAITQGPLVLCVHGFHLLGATMWGIRRTLEGRGCTTEALFLGLPYRDRASYAGALRRSMRRLVTRFPDRPIDIVAHSMGGLVVRMVLAEDQQLAARVRRVVTLGVPHQGTALLRFWRQGPVYRMMAYQTEFVRELPTIGQTAPQAEVTTIASRLDFVVFPLASAHLPEARQVTFEDVSHLGLLVDGRVCRLVADLLCAPEGGEAATGTGAASARLDP